VLLALRAFGTAMADTQPVPETQHAPQRKQKGYKRWLHGKNSWFGKFARQDLPGWTPILSARFVVFAYLLAAIVLLPLGIAVLVSSLNIQEHKVRYDNAGIFANLPDNDARAAALLDGGGNGAPVTVTFTPDKKMSAPVYVYYDLDNYYQNYRRYVRSLDSKQLGGKNSTSGACEPVQYLGDNGKNNSLPNQGRVNPCGLIAYSNFNDTFAVSVGGRAQTIDDSDIAWHYDRDHLYGHYLSQNYNNVPAFRGGNTTTTFIDESQHFMVWMRPDVHSTVRKLYGVINQDIPGGSTVTVRVLNRYNTYDYGGAKYVVLSENSWVGGKNNFLGILLIVLGALALLIAFAFFIAYHVGFVKRRRYGDLSQLSWNKMK
jgi:hypothetical protein